MKFGKISMDSSVNANDVDTAVNELEQKRMELHQIIERINAQRKDIKDKLNSVEKDIEAIIEGRYDNSGYTFNTDSILSDSETLAKLIQQRTKLDIAKDLPNYADPEFREKSIQYIMALAEEVTEEMKAASKRMHETRDSITALQNSLDEQEQSARDIWGKWMSGLMDIGIHEASLYGNETITNYTLYAADYMKICEKYH